MKFLWLYPNAKINIGLKIVSKRHDGYHEIDGFFMPIDWYDVIELGIDFEQSNQMELMCTGIDLPGAPDDNILFRCYDALKEVCGDLPMLKVHLHKNIPIGAGLGGGSADATFFVKALIEACELSISDDQIHSLLMNIGSDCPFFIQNKLSRVTGIGDQIALVPNFEKLPYSYLFLVYPEIHVSSRDAYDDCVPSGDTFEDYVWTDDLSSSHELTNDFEKTVSSIYPEIEKIKEQLFSHGAKYVSMSGSGSTVYGFFDQLQEIKFCSNYVTKLIKL